MGDIAEHVDRGGRVNPHELSAKEDARAKDQRQATRAARDQSVADDIQAVQAEDQKQE